MSYLISFVRRLACIGALALGAVAAGCGGGGSADIVVVAGPLPLAPLNIALTRIGPETVQVDWSDDPFVDTFDVRRDGILLARVQSTTVIDNSVFFDQSYCYEVTGYDRAGDLIAASDRACITIFP